MATRTPIPDAVLSKIESLGQRFLGGPTVDRRTVPFAVEYLEKVLADKGQIACEPEEIVEAAREARLFPWDVKSLLYRKSSAYQPEPPKQPPKNPIDLSTLSQTEFDKLYFAELKRRIDSEKQENNLRGKIRKEPRDPSAPIISHDDSNCTGRYMLESEWEKVNQVPADDPRLQVKITKKGGKKMVAAAKVADVKVTETGGIALVTDTNGAQLGIVFLDLFTDPATVTIKGGEPDIGAIKDGVEGILRASSFKGNLEFQVVLGMQSVEVNGPSLDDVLEELGVEVPEPVEDTVGSDDNDDLLDDDDDDDDEV